MPELLKDITQAEYDRLTREYLEEIGIRDSEKYYHFFSVIQRRAELTLKDKFGKFGIIMERNDASKQFPKKPAMRYKLFFREDPVKMELMPKLLNLTSIIQEIKLVDPNMSSVVPDIKIVVPAYLDAKIEEVTDKVIERFKKMLQQRIRQIKLPEALQKLINESSNYATTPNHATLGNNESHQSQ